MTQELQNKIARLQAEEALKEKVNAALPGIDTLSIVHNDRTRIIARCKTLEEAAKVLSTFPATNEQTVIGTARDKYHAVLDTPYNVGIDNPAAPSQYNAFEVHIHYMSGADRIDIELPVSTLEQFVNRSERAVTDSEYHYFIGVSMSKLRSMRVMCYHFKAKDMGWYGGNRTLLDAATAAEIIATIKG